MKIDIVNLPVVYINMDKDTDRNASMQAIGRDLSIKNYTRSPGFYTPGRPQTGCALAHYTILKDVKEPTVILEDDCVVRHNKLAIEVPDNTDALYLGLSAFGHLGLRTEYGNFNYINVPGYPLLSKIEGMLATHAIVYISQEYISVVEKIAKWSANNDGHVDDEISRIHKYYNVYALNDPVFYQNSNKQWTDFSFGTVHGQ